MKSPSILLLVLLFCTARGEAWFEAGERDNGYSRYSEHDNNTTSINSEETRSEAARQLHSATTAGSMAVVESDQNASLDEPAALIRDSIENNYVAENDRILNINRSVLQPTVRTLHTSAGSISANATEESAPANLNEHSINQLPPQKAHEGYDQWFGDMESITGSGFAALAPMLIKGAGDQLEDLLQEYKQRLNNSSLEAEKACFRDIIQVLENTRSYRNSFFEREKEIAIEKATKRTASSVFVEPQESVAAATIKALMIRGPLLERNITKLLNCVERVKELHQEAADSVLRSRTPSLPQELASGFQSVAERVQNAIQDELDYTQRCKERNLPAAKEIRDRGAYLRAKLDYSSHLAGFYRYLTTVAAETNNVEKAAIDASSANIYFINASEPEIPEQAKNAYIQAGNYFLKAAELGATGRTEEAKNFREAALEAFAGGAFFRDIFKPEVSNQTQNAYIQAGNYRLKGAELLIEGRIEEAKNFKNAATQAFYAGRLFNAIDAHKLTVSEQSPYTHAANYYLDAAKLFAKGKIEEALNFERAAREASPGDNYFVYAYFLTTRVQSQRLE